MDSPVRAISEKEFLENLAWVQALASRLVSDPATAEDVAQDAWLLAIEHPPNRAGHAVGLRAWLWRVVRSLARQSHRSAGRRVRHERAAARNATVAPTIDVVERGSMQRTIIDAVLSLEEPGRTTILLRYLDGLNAREIAELRGESSAAVRKRLSRARKALRGRLEREYGGDQDGLLRALAPLAFAGGGKATTPALGILEGGALVTKTTLAIGIGAAAVVIGAVAWYVHGGDGLQPRSDVPVEAGDELVRALADDTLLPVDDALLPVDGATENARWEVELTSASTDTTVVVEVRLKEDESAVPGVRVALIVEDDEVLAGGSDEGTTDEDGLARFDLLRGTVLARVRVHAGPTTTAVFHYSPVPIATGAEERVVIRVSSGATLSGTVVDTQGVPVGGATVRGWCTYPHVLERDSVPDPDREVTADDAGRFTVQHLGERFVLEAAAPGMACLALLHGELASGEDVDGLELVLGPAGRIDGRVLDPAGAPLGGVQIKSRRGWSIPPEQGFETRVPDVWRADPTVVRATTAADGTFALQHLAPWSYPLRVDHPGLRPWKGSHAPTDGFLEIRLERGLELTGTVFGADARPLPGASVGIRYTIREETDTDAEGRFRLAGLVEYPSAILYVQAPGHAIFVQQPLEIRADAPNVIEIHLEHELVIAGRVVDVEGVGMAGAKVEIEGDRVVDFGSSSMRPIPTWERRHRVHLTQTDEDGAFRLERLYEGEFRVEAVHPENPSLTVVAMVESGAEDLLFVLDPDAVNKVTLLGRVTDALTGEPIRSFTILPLVRDPERGSGLGDRRSVESEDGTYEIGGLPPELIGLWVDAEGYARLRVAEHEYGEGEHVLDLALHPERTLDLRVVDSEGEPLVGVWTWFKDENGENLHYDSVGGGLNWTHRLDTKGELRLSGLPAAYVTFVVGGTLGAEPSEFEVDLRLQSEGWQLFVFDGRRPGHLNLTLFGTTSAPELGEVHVVDDAGGWRELIEERDDVWLLDAPSFKITVRDAAGEVRAAVSATRRGGTEWMVSVTEGDTGFTSNAFMPQVQFAVPRDVIDIEVVAEGYRPFRFRLREDEITRPDVIAIPRALFLQKNP